MTVVVRVVENSFRTFAVCETIYAATGHPRDSRRDAGATSVCKILQTLSGEFRSAERLQEFADLFFSQNVAGRRRFELFLMHSRSKTGPLGEMIMQWTAPAFEEVCLNCEINSYASAKL